MSWPAELKPCPFCGKPVYAEKVPLWRTAAGVTHGYFACYEFVIKCRDPECGCQINLGENNTIYIPAEKAYQNAVNAWNRRG